MDEAMVAQYQKAAARYLRLNREIDELKTQIAPTIEKMKRLKQEKNSIQENELTELYKTFEMLNVSEPKSGDLLQIRKKVVKKMLPVNKVDRSIIREEIFNIVHDDSLSEQVTDYIYTTKPSTEETSSFRIYKRQTKKT